MKRSFGHWSARYLWDRAWDKIHLRVHPDWPWLTPEAVRLLAQLLRPGDRALEFGAGRSTVWLAARVARITSVETHPEWFERVRAMLAQKGIRNSDLRYKELERTADVASEFREGELDFVLVDGTAGRDECLARTIDLLSPGGLMVIDDVHRYVPSASRSPLALREQYASPVWGAAYERMAGWRRIWTSNGVKDTVLLFKP